MSETPLLSHLSRKDSDIFVDGESLSSAAKMHQERKYKNRRKHSSVFQLYVFVAAAVVVRLALKSVDHHQ